MVNSVSILAFINGCLSFSSLIRSTGASAETMCLLTSCSADTWNHGEKIKRYKRKELRLGFMSRVGSSILLFHVIDCLSYSLSPLYASNCLVILPWVGVASESPPQAFVRKTWSLKGKHETRCLPFVELRWPAFPFTNFDRVTSETECCPYGSSRSSSVRIRLLGASVTPSDLWSGMQSCSLVRLGRLILSAVEPIHSGHLKPRCPSWHTCANRPRFAQDSLQICLQFVFEPHLKMHYGFFKWHGTPNVKEDREIYLRLSHLKIDSANLNRNNDSTLTR